MAGDWIPASKGLARKREVLAIAAATGRSRYEVAGIMLEFWTWADDETETGMVAGVGLVHLVGIIGADERFWEAVCKCGWLVVTEEGISLPHFDRWMGESAKHRLKDARRKRQERHQARSANGRQTTRAGDPAIDPNSVAAHDSIRPIKECLRAQVLDKIRQWGANGITLDECCASLGRPPNSLSGRFTELSEAGLIRDSGRRRKTRSGCLATVWEIS